MAGQNKIRVEICGSRYVVSSNESPEYVKRLVNTIENKVKTIMDSGPSVTLNDAYFLALLSYADLYEKSELNADHIRSQLTEYLEDSTKAKLEVDEYRRETKSSKGKRYFSDRTSAEIIEGAHWKMRSLHQWMASSSSLKRARTMNTARMTMSMITKVNAAPLSNQSSKQF